MNEQVKRIIAEIERLLSLREMGFEDGGAEHGYKECLLDLKRFINSLLEKHNDIQIDNTEPTSDCLDNAAKEILMGFGCICTTDRGLRLFDEDSMLSICKAGANWQKRQIMKNRAVGYLIARNKNCLHPLRIYDNKPQRHTCDDGRAFWMGDNIRLPDTLFQEITWKDEPQEAELIIIKK